MTKQPDIKTIEDVWKDRDKINYNFQQIAVSFDNTLSRDASVDFAANNMEVDYDIADANVLNVNVFRGEQLFINGVDALSYADFLMYTISQLPFAASDIIYAPADDQADNLAIGSNGEVLKVGSENVPVWGVDSNDNTVGVTVQEDGVTVADNVTTINFLYAPNVLATVPGAGQVDLDMQLLLGAFWEDTTQANSNLILNTTNVAPLGNSSFCTRVDLVGIGGAIPSTDNEYYVIAEASSYIENQFNGSPLGGTFTLGVRFYDNTGSSTPVTGTVITEPVGEQDGQSNAIHALQTVFCGVPANTRYIDFGWATVPTVPAAAGDAAWSDRYRAIITSALRDSFLTPNGIGYPGGSNTTVTPDPNP